MLNLNVSGHMKWHRKEQERGLVDTSGTPRTGYIKRHTMDLDTYVSQVGTTSDGVHLCTGCGEVLPTFEELKEHVKIHQRCHLCSKILPRMEDLHDHMKVRSCLV